MIADDGDGWLGLGDYCDCIEPPPTPGSTPERLTIPIRSGTWTTWWRAVPQSAERIGADQGQMYRPDQRQSRGQIPGKRKETMTPTGKWRRPLTQTTWDTKAWISCLSASTKTSPSRSSSWRFTEPGMAVASGREHQPMSPTMYFVGTWRIST